VLSSRRFGRSAARFSKADVKVGEGRGGRKRKEGKDILLPFPVFLRKNLRIGRGRRGDALPSLFVGTEG